ncbi:hypothetical protein BS47DRAFT_1350637 [Hydnum rufescens UP504]|uniref:Uncharacterized protein n=1 Tax=Hydnum rufescens UP504 TaxID=1448309 RepID=A0A9P6ALV5_9AGAM|nr:hypothetical protein BS47DRAFT_1350637 [Hydnum rufescens UP504]
MAARRLKNKSWKIRVRGHNPAQCSCEVSLGAAPGTVESEPGVSRWLKDIGLLDET